MSSAIPWFFDAKEYGNNSDDFYTMAKVYHDIGVFKRDIASKVKEAVDGEMYEPYWENINELVNMISRQSDNSEIVELEVYRLAINSIETYARKFKSVGISRSDVEDLFDRVSSAVKRVSTTTQNTEEIKEKIIGRLDATEFAIENAYRG